MIFLTQLCKTHTAQNMKDTFNGAGITIGLFKNNWVEACDPVIGDLAEADFSGYAAVNLGNTWQAPTYAGGAGTTVTTVIATFTHNGGGTNNDIYGYFAKRTDSGALYWVEKNPAAPVVMQPGSPSYVVLATWSAGQWDLEVCPV